MTIADKLFFRSGPHGEGFALVGALEPAESAPLVCDVWSSLSFALVWSERGHQVCRC